MPTTEVNDSDWRRVVHAALAAFYHDWKDSTPTKGLFLSCLVHAILHDSSVTPPSLAYYMGRIIERQLGKEEQLQPLLKIRSTVLKDVMRAKKGFFPRLSDDLTMLCVARTAFAAAQIADFEKVDIAVRVYGILDAVVFLYEEEAPDELLDFFDKYTEALPQLERSYQISSEWALTNSEELAVLMNSLKEI